MVKREGKGSSTPRLLYTEKVPRSVKPRKKFSGRRWIIAESLGRAFGFTLILYMFYLYITTDLSVVDNQVIFALVGVATVVVFYVTEVMSPRARRIVSPIRVYSNGVQVYTSKLEQYLGKPSFIPASRLKGFVLRRITIPEDEKLVQKPYQITFVLTSGRKIRMGRRNVYELSTIISLLEKDLGVKEIQK